MKRARGLFLIGCYTGLRVSDFSRLSNAHVGKYITIKTQKTGTPVIIPIHPVVRDIISGGFDLTDTVSDQKLNGQIKELCRLAGITEEVMVNKTSVAKTSKLSYPNINSYHRIRPGVHLPRMPIKQGSRPSPL